MVVAERVLQYLIERAASDHPHLVSLLGQLCVHQPESRGQVLGQMVSSCRGLPGGEATTKDSIPKTHTQS